jgi:hypothetical protein
LLPIPTHDLNHVIMTSSFPSLWKTGIVVPIINAGVLSLSVFSVLSKLMETLLFEHLLDHLNSNNKLSEFQSGFCRSYITVTSLAKILEDIHLAVENDDFSVAVLCDFYSGSSNTTTNY